MENSHTLLTLQSSYLYLFRIYFAEKPIRDDHLRVLDMVQERATNIKISVELASKGFAETALRMFKYLSDPDALDRVRLKSEFRGENDNRKDEIEATRFVKLTVEMVSCRVWSLAQCTYCHPDCWAGVLDSNTSAAQDAWSKIKNDAETIQSAWEAFQEGRQQAGHKAVGRGTNGAHSIWSYSMLF